MDKIKTKNSKVEIEDDNTSSKAGMSPLKIFSKKLKHEKMGYMDSRMVSHTTSSCFPAHFLFDYLIL